MAQLSAKLLLTALAAVALAGCAALRPKLETPRLSIVGVEVLDSGLWEQRLKVRMRVQNPNERALPVRGLSYTLELEGTDVAQGVSAEGFAVPAFGEAEFDMNVTAHAAAALLRLLMGGEKSLGEAIDYRLVGKVSLASGILRSIPFEEKGSFRLQ